MKTCMGSIIYVPGCDGSNNNTSKKQAQKRPKQPKIDLTRGGGGDYYGRGAGMPNKLGGAQRHFPIFLDCWAGRGSTILGV